MHFYHKNFRMYQRWNSRIYTELPVTDYPKCKAKVVSYFEPHVPVSESCEPLAIATCKTPITVAHDSICSWGDIKIWPSGRLPETKKNWISIVKVVSSAYKRRWLARGFNYSDLTGKMWYFEKKWSFRRSRCSMAHGRYNCMNQNHMK